MCVLQCVQRLVVFVQISRGSCRHRRSSAAKFVFLASPPSARRAWRLRSGRGGSLRDAASESLSEAEHEGPGQWGELPLKSTPG